MLSNALGIDEVFMHYFQNMSSASGSFAADPNRGSALPGRLHTPLFAHPWRKPAGTHSENRSRDYRVGQLK